MRLRDRVALVTAGSRGIGRATALGLAAEGCHVAIASRGQAELDAAAALLRAMGVRVLTIAADMTDAATPARLVARVTAAFGGLGTLVANAGGTLGERAFAGD